jgi:XTP/dITP diphosphohydrolase
VEERAVRRLLLATSNANKVREFRALLGDGPWELVSPADIGLELDVPEEGTTYAENALTKAHAYAAASGLLVLADDSGLEIDALGGAPGVYSARFAGPATPYAERFRILEERLAAVPEVRRSARFRCVIVLAGPDGWEAQAEGVCEGAIAHEPRGARGFGYDPIFFIPELGQTMAELDPDVKNRISHRARAAQQARSILLRYR